MAPDFGGAMGGSAVVADVAAVASSDFVSDGALFRTVMARFFPITPPEDPPSTLSCVPFPNWGGPISLARPRHSTNQISPPMQTNESPRSRSHRASH